jgi:trigger factor
MSDEQNKEGAAVAEHEHVHGPDCDHDHEHDHEPKIEPITLELEDLTADGKAKAEERLKRAIPDVAYTIQASEARPGSVTALTIAVARPAYLAEQTAMLEDLAKEVVLPGFRKGKAPLKLLQIRMGEDAVRSTIAALATNALRQEHAIKDFKFISKPRVVEYDVKTGQEPISFVAEVETIPTVELKEFSGLSVDVEDRPVNDEAIDQRIDQLRRQNAVVETAPEGAALGEEDTVLIKTTVTNELGEVLGHLTKETQTVYDVKRDLPEPVAAQLLGKQVGDVVEATVAAKVTNRKGEEVEHSDHWQVEVLEIKTTKLPALDDEFAKDLGEHDTLDALKAKIRADLTKAEADRQHSEAVGKLLRLMVEKNPVDTPRSLLAHRQYELIMQDQYQLQRMGLRLEQVVTDTDKYLRDQRASADELVKIQLISAELSKRENLEVTDEDVEQEIATVAEQTGRKPLAVRARLEAQKQLDQFRENIARKKLGDFLISKNTINKVAPKPAETPAEPAGESEAEPVTK